MSEKAECHPISAVSWMEKRPACSGGADQGQGQAVQAVGGRGSCGHPDVHSWA